VDGTGGYPRSFDSSLCIGSEASQFKNPY